MVSRSLTACSPARVRITVVTSWLKTAASPRSWTRGCVEVQDWTRKSSCCSHCLHSCWYSSRDEYQQLWRQWEQQDDFRVQSCTSTQPLVQDLGDAAVFSHDVTTVIRTRAGEQAVSERETIVFRRDGDRWAAVHEHLSPRPEPTA